MLGAGIWLNKPGPWEGIGERWGVRQGRTQGLFSFPLWFFNAPVLQTGNSEYDLPEVHSTEGWWVPELLSLCQVSVCLPSAGPTCGGILPLTQKWSEITDPARVAPTEAQRRGLPPALPTRWAPGGRSSTVRRGVAFAFVVLCLLQFEISWSGSDLGQPRLAVLAPSYIRGCSHGELTLVHTPIKARSVGKTHPSSPYYTGGNCLTLSSFPLHQPSAPGQQGLSLLPWRVDGGERREVQMQPWPGVAAAGPGTQ